VGWHRQDNPTKEVVTPNMDALVKDGIELDRHYVHMMQVMPPNGKEQCLYASFLNSVVAAVVTAFLKQSPGAAAAAAIVLLPARCIAAVCKDVLIICLSAAVIFVLANSRCRCCVITPGSNACASHSRAHTHTCIHRCTPTRTSLQSGRLPVHVQLSLAGPCSPKAGMTRNMTAFPQHLARAGYASHHVGK